MNWLVMQLADSSFPAGGFAHSAGIEAASQLGELPEEGVEAFVRDAMWQVGYGLLPIVGDTHREPAEIVRVEAFCDAYLTGAVANRASRTQGRALASACARSFDDDRLARLYDDVRERRLLGHQAPIFGAVAAALGVARTDAQALWIHLALRGLLSAAVRLGLTGAHESQSMQRAMAPLLEQVLVECGEIGCEGVAQTAPRQEIVASQHDHLYSRLFQS